MDPRLHRLRDLSAELARLIAGYALGPSRRLVTQSKRSGWKQPSFGFDLRTPRLKLPRLPPEVVHSPRPHLAQRPGLLRRTIFARQTEYRNAVLNWCRFRVRYRP